MPEPTDVIVLEPGEDGWTYRYAAQPDEVALRLHGYTFCCNRAIAVQADLGHMVPTLNVPGNWPLIDDCCDRPFATHGHKPVELPPYSGEHATCRKCGSKAVETKFTTRGADSADRYGIARAGYPPEWLARRCAVCRAEWNEAVIPESGAAQGAPLTVDLTRTPEIRCGTALLDRSARKLYVNPHDAGNSDLLDIVKRLAEPDGEIAIADTVTSEPNAALYMTCPLRHPYALRTTITTVNGEPRRMHQELVCPRCEADGTTGLIALGGADG